MVCNKTPVPVGKEFCADFGQSLHDKGVVAGDRTRVVSNIELLEPSQHFRQHGQLIKKYLVHVFAEAEQVLFAEVGHLVLAGGVICHEHIVDCKPDLSFNFGKSAALMTLNDGPLLIFKFLLLSPGVSPDPRLGLEKWHKHARNVIILHHLMDDRHRQSLQVIRDEANQTEAGHRAFEINVFDLIFHFFHIRFEKHCFCFLEPVIWLDELSVGQCLTLADHDGELAIAVVDELHEGVIGSVACRAVVQEHFQEVNSGDLMVDL